MAGKRRCRLHGGMSTGPRTPEGRARIAAANTKHGRFVGWRAHREREKYYFAEIRRLMAEAKASGLLEGK
ncbi:MAG: HGGxSTG domain-containing protein [Pseudomonadota bacterium]|nr:HGGxSTG domain-containing protein [Pseudomonadota bacterium]